MKNHIESIKKYVGKKALTGATILAIGLGATGCQESNMSDDMGPLEALSEGLAFILDPPEEAIRDSKRYPKINLSGAYHNPNFQEQGRSRNNAGWYSLYPRAD